MIRGVDVGTTTVKAADTGLDGNVLVLRLGQSPHSPKQIRSEIERLAQSTDATGVSVFRRAVVLPSEDRIIFAAESPPLDHEFIRRLSPAAVSRTSIADPLAVAHRWRQLPEATHRDGLDVLDSWLSGALCGRRVISESAAWLTGLWNPEQGAWDDEVLPASGLPAETLPEVMLTPAMVDRFALPFLGDHQATAAGWAVTGTTRLGLLELGTALAVLVGEPSDRSVIGLATRSPQSAGYREFIDPFFAKRMEGVHEAAPDWMGERVGGGSPINVLRAAVELVFAEYSGPCYIEGGNGLPELTDQLPELRLHGRRDPRVSAPGGAQIFASVVSDGCGPPMGEH